jgi:hypothetical protein
MSEDEVLAYVKATAALLELPLQEERARAVSLHLARTAAMARMLDAVPLAPANEIAEIYCPAPFPADLRP